ncbi:hypothetical protein PGK05_18115 [Acinetobacter baumannii]|nr:hypothetical protein [Acinetobacter baumannii]
MNNKLCILFLIFSCSSFCYAVETIEIHFLGSIVEPACNFFISSDEYCQSKLKKSNSKEVILDLKKINIVNDLNPLIEIINQTNLASIKMIKLSDSSQLGNVIIKYK